MKVDNKTLIVIGVVLVLGFVAFKSGLVGKAGPVGGDDMRGTAAVALAAGTFSGNAPSPEPTPSPDEKPYQKDCTVCQGTGYVKHGDGHVTKCPNCRPNPSDPATEPFDLQEAVQSQLENIKKEISSACVAAKEASDATIAKLEAQLKEAEEKAKAAPVKETPKVNAFASEVDKANELMLQASEEFLAGRFVESGELVKKARAIPDLTEEIQKRIAKASRLLKEKGVNVEPVYVVPKKEYDSKLAELKSLREHNAALKKWGEDWKTYSNSVKQSYPAAWKNSYGMSYGDGGCSSGSCGGGGCSSGSCGGGRMMMGGGGCGGGSCGGGGGGCGFF